MKIHTIQLNIESLLGGCNHMDATEFGAYMSLLVACYQSENNLPSDDKRLSRMARVSPKVWSRIRSVIADKFIQNEATWSHVRVQKEIDKYKLLSTKNRTNGLKTWEKQMPVASVSQCQTDANTNNNHQITSNRKKDIGRKALNTPEDVAENIWQDFKKLRTRRKSEITETALNGIRKEAAIAGWTLEQALAECCARGWQGFKAEWINQKGNQNDKPTRASLADQAVERALARLENEESANLLLGPPVV